MDNAPRHAAILFADVAGSTRLYETAGDAVALTLIGRCIDVMKAVCEERDGRVVKTIGDEVMAVFPSAGNAGYASIDMHGRISRLAEEGGVRLAIHAGFHCGPVLEDAADYYGDTVNVASRLCSLAKGGQTLMAAETLDHLPMPLKVRTRSQDVQAVRGKQADIELFELLWQDSEEDLTTLATRRAGRRAQLSLRYGEREIELDKDDGALTFGRDAANDVVIGDRKASRVHARIERRNGRYFYADTSTNGSYISGSDQPEIMLRRREIELKGSGRICFGASLKDPKADCAEFEQL